MRTWNRYGCKPGESCHCPTSFRVCSAFAALKKAAEEGNPEAVADLQECQTKADARRAKILGEG